MFLKSKSILLSSIILFESILSSYSMEDFECESYMAPSLFVGSGVGIYAGKAFKTGDRLEPVPMLVVNKPRQFEWQLTRYSFEGYFTRLQDHGEEGPTIEEHLIGFGADMMFNHHENPHLLMYVADAYHHVETFVGEQIRSLQYLQPYTVHPQNFYEVLRDADVGDEIFFNYGNTWFDDKDIQFMNSSTANLAEKKLTYTFDELQKVGQCMSSIYINDSTIEGAGSGMFAARAFKKGELLQVSPVLVHSKREILEASNEQCVLINYCISRPDSDVTLLPIALVAMINHGGEQANAEMEWFFWSDDEATRSILQTEPNELCQSAAARLYLGYRATRDISKGEEVMIDYGIDWEQDWFKYVKSRESFRMFKEPLPLFRRAIDAPEGLFPDHWLVDCIGFFCD